jgi:hypothetical protein
MNEKGGKREVNERKWDDYCCFSYWFVFTVSYLELYM